MVGIYQIKNKLNGKIYIGQSVNIKRRWKDHRNRPFNKKAKQYDSYLYKAIRKEGIDNFEFLILEECSKELLDEKEKEWISKTKSNDNKFGYNMTDGGDSACNKYTKLDISIVKKIRSDLSDENLSQTEISKKYNVSQVAISNINVGLFWHDPNINYPIRDRKKHNFCKICGKEIYRTSTLCVNCAKNASRDKYASQIDEIYNNLEEMVLSCNGNLTKVAKYYNVTSNTIMKKCVAKNIDYKQIRSNRKK